MPMKRHDTSAGALWGLVLCAVGLLSCVPPNRQGNAARSATDAPANGAAALHAQCTRGAVASRMGCYNSGILASMKSTGIAAAMSLLDSLSAMDAAVKRDGHMYAHALGLTAYAGADRVGATFRQCTPAFQSGCYHGVIQAYFSDVARASGADTVSTDAVNDLCKAYRTPADAWLLFQCVHGIGHGLSQVTRHVLKRTLDGCDALRSPWEREACYGGAFMENQMEAFQPHHMVGRPGEMEHMGDMADMPGMEHNARADPGAAKLIDATDPLYPCSALSDGYLAACYLSQTSIMLALNHNDVTDAARTCDRVTVKYRGVCYQSLGRDVSSITQQDFGRAATLCASGDPVYQPWCHTGFVKNVIDITADYKSGAAYCGTLSAGPGKAACYRAVGEEVAALMPENARRVAACSEMDVAYIQACRNGAQVYN